jgi:hypothetical protein
MRRGFARLTVLLQERFRNSQERFFGSSARVAPTREGRMKLARRRKYMAWLRLKPLVKFKAQAVCRKGSIQHIAGIRLHCALNLFDESVLEKDNKRPGSFV